MIETNLVKSVTKNMDNLLHKYDRGLFKTDEDAFKGMVTFGVNCFQDGRKAGFKNAVVCLIVGGALYYWYKKRPVKEESSDDSEGCKKL